MLHKENQHSLHADHFWRIVSLAVGNVKAMCRCLKSTQLRRTCSDSLQCATVVIQDRNDASPTT